MRKSSIRRETAETKISLSLNLDGNGKAEVNTGVGFFDHMLTLFAFHSGIDLNVQADGDLNVCDHHTIEDVGIALGRAFKEALGDKKGINRYGNAFIPMDESLAQVVIDISGRSFLAFDCELKRESIGNFSTEMVKEFLRAFAFNSNITLHVRLLYGENDHHKIEGIFKALGRALKEAKMINKDKEMEIPSTKGCL